MGADWLLWGLIALVLGASWFNAARRAAEGQWRKFSVNQMTVERIADIGQY